MDWCKITEFPKNGSEYTGKWQTSAMECPKCAHKQVSVHPVTCEYLECGLCGHMMPAPFVEESLE